MPPIKAALTWIALSFALFSGSTSVQAAQQNAPGTVPDLLDNIVQTISAQGDRVLDSASTDRYALIYMTTAEGEFITITLRALPTTDAVTEIVTIADKPSNYASENRCVTAHRRVPRQKSQLSNEHPTIIGRTIRRAIFSQPLCLRIFSSNSAAVINTGPLPCTHQTAGQVGHTHRWQGVCHTVTTP